MNVLVIGDVVGRMGREAIYDNLKNLKKKYSIDLCIVNVENATHGNGLSRKNYEEFVNAGVDVMTMGNHTFGKPEIREYIKNTANLLMPINLKEAINDEDLKKHMYYRTTFEGKQIVVISVLGMDGIKMEKIHNIVATNAILNDDSESIYIIDHHAELTAEKNVFGYCFDGMASVIFGTHTHVQTADERILPKGTAYITDVGMCGVRESVIGYNYEQAVKVMFNGGSYDVASNGVKMINGLVVNIDLETKKATYIERINFNCE